MINYEENFKIPYLEINYIKGTEIIDNKLEIKYTYLPKINLMQPIYCDFNKYESKDYSAAGIILNLSDTKNF